MDGRDRVIEHIPKYAPIHEYRREYAQDLYDWIARPVDDLPAKEVYCCSGDQTGLYYDKAAMRTVSRALGHNRLEVVTHYLSHGLTETETIETVEEETEELEEAND